VMPTIMAINCVRFIRHRYHTKSHSSGLVKQPWDHANAAPQEFERRPGKRIFSISVSALKMKMLAGGSYGPPLSLYRARNLVDVIAIHNVSLVDVDETPTH